MIDKQEVGEDCECEIQDPSSGTDRRVTTTTTLNTEKKASPMFDAGTIYWSTTKSRFVLPPHPSSSNGMRHSNSRCFRILIFFLLTHLLCECLYIMCNSNTYGRRSLFFWFSFRVTRKEEGWELCSCVPILNERTSNIFRCYCCRAGEIYIESQLKLFVQPFYAPKFK